MNKKEYQREWRKKHPGYWRQWEEKHKSERAEYHKRYRQEHKEELNRKRQEKIAAIPDYYRNHYAEHREYLLEKSKKWGKEHREKLNAKQRKYRSGRYSNAHSLVYSAIKCGRLSKQPCEVCGAEPAEAHHDDYNKPLKVRWLCKQCHSEWHRNNNPKEVKENA